LSAAETSSAFNRDLVREEHQVPTLNWIGKRTVVNHHWRLSYRLLECDRGLSAGDPAASNLLVQGDNLEVLKALLPYYAGRIKCIYVDPPYNTGREDWVYNDNVNSPELRKWLGEVVGLEVEHLDRHDKWLCMMYPRLALLKEFLREDGIILCSIDDAEAHRARCLLDELFGPENFIAQLVWDKTRKNDAKLFSAGHEYIIVYARSLQRLKALKTTWRERKSGAREVIEYWRDLKRRHGEDYEAIQEALRAWYKSLPKNHPSRKLSRYKWVDRNGPWRDRDISWPGGGGPRYTVRHPRTGLPCKVPERGWGFATREEMQRQIQRGLIEFRKDHNQPPFRKAHLLPIPREPEASKRKAKHDRAENASHEAGLQVMASVFRKQTQASAKLLRKIFDGRKVFPNPKDHEVLMRLIRYVTGPDDIVLDAFAGSGSTGHAVLQLNHEDGGNRRFILVEIMEDTCKAITAERLRRVIEGGEDLRPLGGGFRFCRLGPSLFDETGAVDEAATFSDVASHVFFIETGMPMAKRATAKSPLLGVYQGKALYLLYNGVFGDKRPIGGNVLTRERLRTLPPHDGPRIIYGEESRLAPQRLKRERIVFKQVPHEIKMNSKAPASSRSATQPAPTRGAFHPTSLNGPRQRSHARDRIAALIRPLQVAANESGPRRNSRRVLSKGTTSPSRPTGRIRTVRS
jgi:adenine-specific DNA-methyltransferase